MKILHCDSCHAEVNDYGHWYNDEKSRNMYELNCVHESDIESYGGMIICHKCIAKLLHKTESDEQEEIDDWRDRLDELEREEYYESKYGKEQE